MFSNILLFKELTTEDQIKLWQVGSHFWISPGKMLFKQGAPAHYFYVVLEGAIRIKRKIDNREIVVATYGTDTFFGEVPLLAGTSHLASGQAVGLSHIYSMHCDDFWQMLIAYPSVRKAVLGLMASRLEELLMITQHCEKLFALGTLAAGLAHELNNPVSAAQRVSEQLRNTMQDRHTVTLKHIQKHLTQTQLNNLLNVKHNAIKYATTSSHFDPLTQIDLEDKLINWLDEHDIVEGWRLVSTFVAEGITNEHLETLSKQFETDTLSDVVTWLEATLAEANLLNVLKHSTTRVSELVNAVKAYSYMDQALLKQKNVDVHEGLENTLTILNHKLRKHGVSVIRNYVQNLPTIQADGSALNQVWTNLIDNAIDVLGEQGTIWVSTLEEKDYIVVEIADNGPGIPPEIQPRIFQPFFTTKEIGQGIGIGLCLVYRIVVNEHGGTISCLSKPGDTRFLVRLPIYQCPPA